MSQNKGHLPIRRRLSRDATLPERLLWSRLKRAQSGFSFRRQHSIGPYIVDFYCPRTRLVVEVDRDCHAIPEVEQRDRDREEYFWERGYEVLRFSKQEIEEALEGVWKRTGERCRERVELIPPLQSPQGGDGVNCSPLQRGDGDKTSLAVAPPPPLGGD